MTINNTNNMNLRIITIFAIIALCSSCANHKIVISGPVGTEIYNPDDECVATIDADGKTKYNIKRRTSYLLKAKMPNSDIVVPFALDYKKGHRTRNAIFMITGLGIYLPQAWFGFGDEFSFPGYGNMKFDKKYQLPTALNIPEPKFNHYIPEQEPTQNVQDTQAASKSAKKLNSPADQLKGEYRCQGKLSHGSDIVEDYADITVSIKKLAANLVGINVVEPSGQEYFITPEKYKITKESDGTYLLTHETVPSATITISKRRNLSFVHPAIIIDGDTYKLTLKSK